MARNCFGEKPDVWESTEKHPGQVLLDLGRVLLNEYEANDFPTPIGISLYPAPEGDAWLGILVVS